MSTGAFGLGSTFRRSLPVTATSFINKAGTIGLSIVPILLVERGYSTSLSAWIMGAIQASAFAGVLVGGWSCDALGLRSTLLLSFIIAGAGLLPLPFAGSALTVCLCACVAQLGTSFYYASARLLLTRLVRPEERREAIAWQRTANNLAQILSFSLGALFSKFGTMFLILFDAATSFLAVGVGARILPRELPAEPAPAARTDATAVVPPTRREFYRCALLIASFSFLYELFSVAAAARCKVLFGDHGVEVFSELMVLNTVLCATLAVVAAKRIGPASTAIPAGVIMLAFGMICTFAGGSGRFAFFVGMLIVTMGEITFNALAGLVLIRATPPGARQGTTYSSGILIQFVGRIAGGALAFPMLVGSDRPLAWSAILSVPAIAYCWSARPLIRRLES